LQRKCTKTIYNKQEKTSDTQVTVGPYAYGAMQHFTQRLTYHMFLCAETLRKTQQYIYTN